MVLTFDPLLSSHFEDVFLETDPREDGLAAAPTEAPERFDVEGPKMADKSWRRTPRIPPIPAERLRGLRR